MKKLFKRKHTGLIIGLASAGGAFLFALLAAFFITNGVGSENEYVTAGRHGYSGGYGFGGGAYSCEEAENSLERTREAYLKTEGKEDLKKVTDAMDKAVTYFKEAKGISATNLSDRLLTSADDANNIADATKLELNNLIDTVKKQLETLGSKVVFGVEDLDSQYKILVSYDIKLTESQQALADAKTALECKVLDIEEYYKKKLSNLVEEYNVEIRKQENRSDDLAATIKLDFDIKMTSDLMKEEIAKVNKDYEPIIGEFSENIMEINALIEEYDLSKVIFKTTENEEVLEEKSFFDQVEEPEFIDEPNEACYDQKIVLDTQVDTAQTLPVTKFVVETEEGLRKHKQEDEVVVYDENASDKNKYWNFVRKETTHKIPEC